MINWAIAGKSVTVGMITGLLVYLVARMVYKLWLGRKDAASEMWI